MQAARLADAPGQRDVQRLGLQLRFQLGVRQRLAALVQRGLDRLLGLVDGRAARFFSSTESAARPFISSVMRPDLPTYCALAFSSSAGVWAWRSLTRAADDRIEFLGHGKKTGASASQP